MGGDNFSGNLFNKKVNYHFTNIIPLYGDDPEAHGATNESGYVSQLPQGHLIEDEDGMAEFLHSINPLTVGQQISQYLYSQGIVVNPHELGTMTGEYLRNHPDLFNMLKDAAHSLWDHITTPFDTTNIILKMLPWALGGLIVSAIVFAFKNPGVVRR